MNILVASHCLGGLDGVSQVAETWILELEKTGHQVTEAAGIFFSSRPRPHHVIEGLWASSPGAFPPPLDKPKIFELVQQSDVIIVENLFTLPANPLAGLCFYEAITRYRRPSIVHHHDFAWEDPRRPAHEQFPLLPADSIHVVISQTAKSELLKRKNVTSHVIYNSLRLTAISENSRTRVRAQKGISNQEFLILHPSRIYPRKNIPRAIDFCNRLDTVLDKSVVYWLTGSNDRNDTASTKCKTAHGDIVSIAEGYAAADLVIMSSDWEGWGSPVVEAAASGVPIVSSRYPILSEIESFGIRTYSLDNLSWVSSIDTNEWEEQKTDNRVSVEKMYQKSMGLDELFRLAGL